MKIAPGSIVARPRGRNEIAIESMQLEKHGGVVVFKCALSDGAILNLPMSDEAAKGLGNALLDAVGRVITPMAN